MYTIFDYELSVCSAVTSLRLKSIFRCLLLYKCVVNVGVMIKHIVRHVTCVAKKINVCSILVGNYKGKGPSRTRCRWEDNIETVFNKIGLRALDCIYLAQHD